MRTLWQPYWSLKLGSDALQDFEWKRTVCLAKTYTCRMNDLAQSWIRIFPLQFLP
jgi:hypothetical protein